MSTSFTYVSFSFEKPPAGQLIIQASTGGLSFKVFSLDTLLSIKDLYIPPSSISNLVCKFSVLNFPFLKGNRKPEGIYSNCDDGKKKPLNPVTE